MSRSVYFPSKNAGSKKNEDKPEYNNYQDLAHFIETLHAHDPRSEKFATAMESVMEGGIVTTTVSVPLHPGELTVTI